MKNHVGNHVASEAAIIEISVLNFKKLIKLKFLDLHENKIEFIPDDCFKGLKKLQSIELSMKILIFIKIQ